MTKLFDEWGQLGKTKGKARGIGQEEKGAIYGHQKKDRKSEDIGKTPGVQ